MPVVTTMKIPNTTVPKKAHGRRLLQKASSIRSTGKNIAKLAMIPTSHIARRIESAIPVAAKKTIHEMISQLVAFMLTVRGLMPVLMVIYFIKSHYVTFRFQSDFFGNKRRILQAKNYWLVFEVSWISATANDFHGIGRDSNLKLGSHPPTNGPSNRDNAPWVTGSSTGSARSLNLRTSFGFSH